jgi:hypothetical protein
MSLLILLHLSRQQEQVVIVDLHQYLSQSSEAMRSEREENGEIYTVTTSSRIFFPKRSSWRCFSCFEAVYGVRSEEE